MPVDLPGSNYSSRERKRQRRRLPQQIHASPLRSILNPSSLIILSFILYILPESSSFTSPRGISIRCREIKSLLSISSSISTTTSIALEAVSSSASTLPDLYPNFSNILSSKGYIIPTPIQQSSSVPAKDGENLLLIAATGSGKTLAYFLPVLSRACDGNNREHAKKRTVLVVSPTRELAAQLARDASLLLPDKINNNDGDVAMLPNVLLAVRGIPPPTPTQLSHATVLIGTPNELYAVLTRISGAKNFIAGDTLSGVILDEVDVLLPPAPKTFRTTFDGKGDSDTQERRMLEQRRKLRAAQRRGVEFQGGSSIKGKKIDAMDDERNSQVLTPTERVLRLIASGRYMGYGNDNRHDLQLMAGSATASRGTLDRLNKALRWAALEGGVIGGDGLEGVWKGRTKICRPDDGGNDQEPGNDDAHTIRAVTVPSVVNHKFVSMSKSDVTNPHAILANVATILKSSSKSSLAAETSLVFICGEFSRSLVKEKEKALPKVSGKTSESRRNTQRGRVLIEKQKAERANGKGSSGRPEPLSVRRACSMLQAMGVNAHPMHVVLGLEPNVEVDGMTSAEEDQEAGNWNEVDLPPVLVTFEGSARGLHFDGVDTVFVVGRPTSAASYLHLAGRVGRAKPVVGKADDYIGGFEVLPGTIVSFCSKGQVAELEKWTSQVGATDLEEIVCATSDIHAI
ncbi:hypothetical protein ACHAXH_006753 [Discostella pseudostelligera]